MLYLNSKQWYTRFNCLLYILEIFCWIDMMEEEEEANFKSYQQLYRDEFIIFTININWNNWNDNLYVKTFIKKKRRRIIH